MNEADRLNYDLSGEIDTTGSSNAYDVQLARDVTAYHRGLRFRAKASFSNTGACTINVNALGTVSIKLPDGTDPGSGDINSGSIYHFIYDGTNFQTNI